MPIHMELSKDAYCTRCLADVSDTVTDPSIDQQKHFIVVDHNIGPSLMYII